MSSADGQDGHDDARTDASADTVAAPSSPSSSASSSRPRRRQRVSSGYSEDSGAVLYKGDVKALNARMLREAIERSMRDSGSGSSGSLQRPEEAVPAPEAAVTAAPVPVPVHGPAAVSVPDAASAASASSAPSVPASSSVASLSAASCVSGLAVELVSQCGGCGGATEASDPVPILICDRCDAEWHFRCIQPPLEGVPAEEDEWACPTCVKSGPKKKRKRRSAANGNAAAAPPAAAAPAQSAIPSDGDPQPRKADHKEEAGKAKEKDKEQQLENGKAREKEKPTATPDGGSRAMGGSAEIVRAAAVDTGGGGGGGVPFPAWCQSQEERARFSNMFAHYSHFYPGAPASQIISTITAYWADDPQGGSEDGAENAGASAATDAKRAAAEAGTAAATAAPQSSLTLSVDGGGREEPPSSASASAAGAALSLSAQPSAAASLSSAIPSLPQSAESASSLPSPAPSFPAAAGAPPSATLRSFGGAAPPISGDAESIYRQSLLVHQHAGGGFRHCCGLGCGNAEQEAALFSVCGQCLTAVYCLSDDTRLLTDEGFLFVDEIRERLQLADDGLAVLSSSVQIACFDKTKQCLEYHPPSQFILKPHGPHRMVEFSHHGERRSWTANADEYGRYAGKLRGNRVSLLVTEDHDMYVQQSRTSKGGGPLRWERRPFEKVKAQDLLSDDPYQRVRLQACAPAGVSFVGHTAAVDEKSSGDGQPEEDGEAAEKEQEPAEEAGLDDDDLDDFEEREELAGLSGEELERRWGEVRGLLPFVDVLGLQTMEQVLLFLELYGFWLGDGSMDFNGPPGWGGAIRFSQRKQTDIDWLLRVIPQLGVVDVRVCIDAGANVTIIRICDPAWFDLFENAYGIKYRGSRLHQQPGTTFVQPPPSTAVPVPPCTRSMRSASLSASASAVAGEDDIDAARRASFSVATTESSAQPSAVARQRGFSCDTDEEPSARTGPAAAGQQDVACTLCSSAAFSNRGNGRILVCERVSSDGRQCPHGLHLHCAGMQAVPREEWFCFACRPDPTSPTEPWCLVCGRPKSPDPDRWLHVCGGTSSDGSRCLRGLHVRCDARDKVPEGQWFCPGCASARNVQEDVDVDMGEGVVGEEVVGEDDEPASVTFHDAERTVAAGAASGLGGAVDTRECMSPEYRATPSPDAAMVWPEDENEEARTKGVDGTEERRGAQGKEERQPPLEPASGDHDVDYALLNDEDEDDEFVQLSDGGSEFAQPSQRPHPEEDETLKEEDPPGKEIHPPSTDDEEPPTDSGELMPPTRKSVKWFWYWVLARLSRAQIRRVLRGYRRADGRWRNLVPSAGEGADGDDASSYVPQMLFTSCESFRDDLIIACLHAGFTAFFHLVHKAGVTTGYTRRTEKGEPRDTAVYSPKVVEALSRRQQKKYQAITATADAWAVHYARPARGRQGGALAAAITPTLHSKTDVRRVDDYVGRVWCVTVPTGLIVVQRVKKNGKGVVTYATRPIVVGNCSRDCQARHWKAGHKLECKQLALRFQQIQHRVAVQ